MKTNYFYTKACPFCQSSDFELFNIGQYHCNNCTKFFLIPVSQADKLLSELKETIATFEEQLDNFYKQGTNQNVDNP